MSDLKRIEGNALREYDELCRAALEATQREAMNLERHPEGEESRDPLIVDGHLIMPEPRQRIRGKLTVRWG